MISTAPTQTLYLATDPAFDLRQAYPAHEWAEDKIDAYGRLWVQAAERIGRDTYGVTVEAIATGRADVVDDHVRRNGPRRVDGERDLIDEIWQAAHDAIDIDADGTPRPQP